MAAMLASAILTTLMATLPQWQRTAGRKAHAGPERIGRAARNPGRWHVGHDLRRLLQSNGKTVVASNRINDASSNLALLRLLAR